MSENSKTVAVVGAGKMGLPVAAHVASRGFRVLACDINPDLVDRINAADCPIAEPGLQELLERAVKSGALTATTDTAAAAAQADAVIVLVPVMLRHVAGGKRNAPKADLSAMEHVFAQIGDSLRPGALLAVETTLPVGTMRRLVEDLEARTNRIAGIDFYAVFSPERVKSLHVLDRLGRTPKVVGGKTEDCVRAGEQFYAEALGAPVVNVGTLEAAEMTKLADMIYRDVNIALANELAQYCEKTGVAFSAVRQAANTSGESALLLPGIGVGGHCTPVYPWFAISDAAERELDLPITRKGREVNERQPVRLLDRLETAVGSLSGRRVLILGFAFRPGVKEHSHTPARALQRELLKRGARVRVHDPLYSEAELHALETMPHDDWQDGWAEILVLQTAHTEYAAPDFDALVRAGTEALLDGRNVWDGAAAEAAGLRYIGVGTPSSRASRSR